MKKSNSLGILLAGLVFVSCNQATKTASTTASSADTTATVSKKDNVAEFAGEYKGVLPCADCPGIETDIILMSDDIYRMTQKYQVDSMAAFKYQGKGTWNADHTIFTAIIDGQKNLFKVEKDQLRYLDSDGKPINGKLAEYYVLKKVK